MDILEISILASADWDITKESLKVKWV